MCIGVAGAIGFLFFIIAVGGFNRFDALIEQIRVISVSTIAGFGARSLLPRMLAPLEKQIADAKETAGEAKDTAGEAKNEAESASKEVREATEKIQAMQKTVDRLDLNTKLIEAGHPNAPSEMRIEILNLALKYIQSGEANCAIWINMARVQRLFVVDDALQTLRNALDEIDAGRLIKDKNYYAIYYNMACYYEQRFHERGNDEDRKEVFRCLDLCLAGADKPWYEIELIPTDEDLKEILDLPEFKALVAKYKRA